MSSEPEISLSKFIIVIMSKRKAPLSLSEVLLELGFDENGNSINDNNESTSFSLSNYLFTENEIYNGEVHELLDSNTVEDEDYMIIQDEVREEEVLIDFIVKNDFNSVIPVVDVKEEVEELDSKVEDDKNYDNHNDEVKESLLEIVQTIEKKKK